MPDVAVALSGGVDSSVAAALLVEAGRNMVGVTMDLGLAESGTRDDPITLARGVCDALGIPHVVIDLAGPFREQVVGPFVDAYAAGLTPNPCVSCNERIKFGLLATRVRELGATALATGHYARIAREDGRAWLERAADRTKDQSYFLYRIAPHVLDTLEFPLGDLTKAEVRRMAEERGLPTAARRESQEVCFTGDHVALVGTAHPGALAPGPIVTTDGRVLGTHRGIARYTVGQRKGLGVGGPEGPYRVVPHVARHPHRARVATRQRAGARPRADTLPLRSAARDGRTHPGRPRGRVRLACRPARARAVGGAVRR